MIGWLFSIVMSKYKYKGKSFEEEPYPPRYDTLERAQAALAGNGDTGINSWIVDDISSSPNPKYNEAQFELRIVRR